MDPSNDPGLRTLELDAVSRQIERRLRVRTRSVQDDQLQLRRAAVAITLFNKSESAHFLMIKRVGWGSNPGQWALPGGRMDGTETILETAMRELREETGLESAAHDILGILDDFPASRGIVITPVVVRLRGIQHPPQKPSRGGIASPHTVESANSNRGTALEEHRRRPPPVAGATAPRHGRARTDRSHPLAVCGSGIERQSGPSSGPRGTRIHRTLSRPR